MRPRTLAAETTDGAPMWRGLAALCAIFALALVPIIATPVLPLIDYYNHLARYFVLAHLKTSEFLAQHYAANWSLLPNIGMDILGTLLMRVAPPLLSGHLLAGVILFTIYSGVLALNYQLRKSARSLWLIAILLVPLLYSYIFVWGFANFLIGLGLSFWAAAWWIRARGRLIVALPVACLLAICIFLAHGLAFALYGLLLGGLELGLLIGSVRPWAPQLLRAFIGLSAQAVVPALMFVSTTTAKSEQGLTNADESVRRLIEQNGLVERVAELAIYRLQTIVRVAEGPTLWFDLLTFALTLAGLTALARMGRISLPKVIWPSLAIGAILVVVTPPALFGVGYVADRMPLFLALVALAGLRPNLRGDRMERIWIALLIILVAARIGYIALDWQKYRRDMAEFQAVASEVPPHSLVTGFTVSLRKHVSVAPRCEMYGPLMIALHNQAGPLFANATQQPLRLVGDLSQAVKLPKARGLSDEQAPEHFARYIAAANAAGYYQYLIICQADRVRAPLPPGATVLKKTERFTLVRLAPRKPAHP